MEAIRLDKKTVRLIKTTLKNASSTTYAVQYCCIRKGCLMATNGRCGVYYSDYGKYDDGIYELQGDTLIPLEMTTSFPKLEEVIETINNATNLGYCGCTNEAIAKLTLANVAVDYIGYVNFIKAVFAYSPNVFVTGAKHLVIFNDGNMTAVLSAMEL